MTLRAHGNTEPSEARRKFPASSRDSRYFISPARPAAIQSGKRANSGKLPTAAIPESSNPASRAALLIASSIPDRIRKFYRNAPDLLLFLQTVQSLQFNVTHKQSAKSA